MLSVHRNYPFELISIENCRLSNDIIMFWSCRRTGQVSSFPRFGMLAFSLVRFKGITRNHWHKSQQRLIFSRCFKELNVTKYLSSRLAIKPAMFPSPLLVESRRFVVSVTSKKLSVVNTQNRTTAVYVIALAIAVLGLSYLAVPLYRLYCQVSMLFSKYPIHIVLNSLSIL